MKKGLGESMQGCDNLSRDSTGRSVGLVRAAARTVDEGSTAKCRRGIPSYTITETPCIVLQTGMSEYGCT